jgi:hypothetical protein
VTSRLIRATSKGRCSLTVSIKDRSGKSKRVNVVLLVK